MSICGGEIYRPCSNAHGLDDLFENTAAVRVDGYMTDLITVRAVRFIEQHAADPFFLDISYNAAHWPFQPHNLRAHVSEKSDLARDRIDLIRSLRPLIASWEADVDAERKTLGGSWRTHCANSRHRAAW